jgi:hypothetical protein
MSSESIRYMIDDVPAAQKGPPLFSPSPLMYPATVNSHTLDKQRQNHASLSFPC